MKKLTINFHFTDFCNFSCKHCFIKKENNELTLDQIKEIVDKIKDYSTKTHTKIRINLAGGEPLLSKNIQQIIDYIYFKGLEISIITNGYFLTEKFIQINRYKVNMIGISIDSISENTNLYIGRCCSTKTISKNEIIELCKIIKENGIKLKVNTCISKSNYSENLNDFYKTIKPDRIKILRIMCDHNSGVSNLQISDDEWNNIIHRYEKINPIFEDNEFMKQAYYIIDSNGNVSKDNLHIKNNSLFDKTLDECLKNLKLKEVV